VPAPPRAKNPGRGLPARRVVSTPAQRSGLDVAGQLLAARASRSKRFVRVEDVRLGRATGREPGRDSRGTPRWLRLSTVGERTPLAGRRLRGCESTAASGTRALPTEFRSHSTEYVGL
jgi:hypothetical protein